LSENHPIQPAISPDETESGRFIKNFRASRLILPILLGLSAVAWLFYKQFDWRQISQIKWTGAAFAWIGLSFLLLLVRHLFYSLRMHAITGGVFSWKKCIELIVLWEFSSALTPTSKGGPFVMMFALTKEGLSAGRTAAAVFYTMVCDAGFFVLLTPVLLLFYGPSMLYPGMKSYQDVGLASGAFFVTYAMMATYWLALMFLLILKPQYTRFVMLWLARRRWLKRWEKGLTHLADEFGITALEIKTQDWRYHGKVILGTLGAWTSKFLMINCLIIAIVPTTPIDGGTQAFIYARLLAMFIIMAFSPTPGGAGLAEVALTGFISDYVPGGLSMVVALLWRGMAYYGYLIAGAIVAPRWIARKLGG
jgi:uncharacterized protein (TIRG00374 family)